MIHVEGETNVGISRNYSRMSISIAVFVKEPLDVASLVEGRWSGESDYVGYAARQKYLACQCGL